MADKVFFVGAILAALAIVTWVFVPLGKFVRYLATGDELARVRTRAVTSTLVFFAALSTSCSLTGLAGPGDSDGDGLDDSIDACYDPGAPDNMVSHWGFEEDRGRDG